MKQQRLGKGVNLGREKEKRKERNKEGCEPVIPAFQWVSKEEKTASASGKNYICSLLSKLRLVN